jgi:hypothetical protein
MKSVSQADRPEFGRRTLLKWAGAIGLGSVTGSDVAANSVDASSGRANSMSVTTLGAPATASNKAPQNRFALLVGNRHYPKPYDLPPTHKNVNDLGQALQQRGFRVFQALDQNASSMNRMLMEFVARLSLSDEPPVCLFYFTGHGLQLKSDNLLLGPSVTPKSRGDQILTESLQLQHQLLQSLPKNARGLTMTVIDACRTDLIKPNSAKAALHAEGLTQMEAPEGGVIVFSTQAGRPAIAPDSADKNTFFTESMVKHLNMASPDWTFSDLFQMVRHDVRESMLRHPFAVIRKLAQDPFIADNSRVPVTVGNTLNTVDLMSLRLKGEELYMWNQLRQTRWPLDVLNLSDRFLTKYPNTEARMWVELSRKGVILASRALNRRDLKLHRTGFVLPDGVNSDFAHEDLLRASRGDKDAAARVGRLHRESSEMYALFRFEAWMMYATALGNGIACYELALFYRNQNQPALAAAAESKAVELGFSPPVGLDHFRK